MDRLRQLLWTGLVLANFSIVACSESAAVPSSNRTKATAGSASAGSGSSAVGGSSGGNAGASSRLAYGGSHTASAPTIGGTFSADTFVSSVPTAGSCATCAPGNAPVGYGARVTGGGDAAPVEVNSMEAMVSAIAAYRKGTQGLVLRYTGSFDFNSIIDPCTQFEKAARIVEIKDVSNLTIVGASGSSANFGLHLSRVSNVIVRNMTLGLLPGGGSSDAIGIEGESSGIWIDHNELLSSMVECEGAGDSEFDGLLDIKDGSHDYDLLVQLLP